jgi:hypothetical protein
MVSFSLEWAIDAYWARVSGYGGTLGPITLTLSCPSANRCEKARWIQCNQTLEGSTVGSGADNSVLDCRAAPSAGLAIRMVFDSRWETRSGWSTWFRLRVKPPVASVVMSTHGSSFDTQLSVYSGNQCQQRTCVATNDDAGPRHTYHSEVKLLTVGSGRYLVAVHGYGSTQGRVSFSVRCDFRVTP